MKKPAEEEILKGFFENYKQQFSKDHSVKFVSLYYAIGFIILFLFVLSLAPQIGNRLGIISHKKQSQQSFAKEKESTASASESIYHNQLIGKVTPSQLPVADVEIIIKSKYFNTKATTDDQGNYQISEIPPGKYGVEATKADIKSEKKPLLISDGQTVTLDFELTE